MLLLFTFLIFLLPVFVVMGAVEVTRRLSRRRSVSPLDPAETTRIPGFTLVTQIMDKSFDCACYLMLTMFAPMYPFAFRSFADFYGVKAPGWGVTYALSAIMVCYCALKAYRAIVARQNLRLGLDAEWAVAAELQMIPTANVRVFHDVQCGKFNIDHVVTSPFGVLAVETKGRRKPIIKNKQTGDKKKQYKVTADQQTLYFPHAKDADTIPQALRQGKWLMDYLHKETGEPTPVEPIAVLPGWFIQLQKSCAIRVMPSSKLHLHVIRQNTKLLEDAQLLRINTQIEKLVKRNTDVF